MRNRGLTIMEVMFAMFIFVVGVVGVLGAIPTGVSSASTIIFQDAALQLSNSKFAEFRRDRIDPATDLGDDTAYMPAGGSFVIGQGKQEPHNGSAGNWRDFPHGIDEPYQYFDDIERYEWKVETSPVSIGAGDPVPAPNYMAPIDGAGPAIGVTRVRLIIHMKGTSREFGFTQYMTSYR
jgi:hypothetical protein